MKEAAPWRRLKIILPLNAAGQPEPVRNETTCLDRRVCKKRARPVLPKQDRVRRPGERRQGAEGGPVRPSQSVPTPGGGSDSPTGPACEDLEAAVPDGDLSRGQSQVETGATAPFTRHHHAAALQDKHGS